ncbi:hypothetical protein NQ117_14710 [Paenibacillus sp. SC116]|uniref:hypothetical protein n=1 Tax=Paenibacillus sp. SC116 TaxID=2968986 RepID=UPI00215A15BC|nr:hypothetical protein [Paenibacillus sp. SC116]MCR8844931.1 hypothetical protein [Paenibacillus sp. SC116]
MLRKKTWIVFTLCCSIVVGGLALANMNGNHANANSPSLNEKLTYTTTSYEAQKKIADAPGATTADEQKLKELATKAENLQSELAPKSALDEFNEVFAGYKDLHAIHSTYYADKKDSTDPAVQKVLYELEQKGKLIAHFEKPKMLNSVNGEELLKTFYEETYKLNQKLYPENFK